MATYDYEIANLALVRIGAERITSLTDGSRNANEINAVFTLIRDEVLRSHPWNFAIRVADLVQHVANVLTITDITQANPGVVTYTGTDPEDGDEYLIEDVVGMTELNDNIYTVQNVNTTGNTFELYNSAGQKLNTITYTAYTSDGTATEQTSHQSTEYAYVYHLPSDFLRMLQFNDDPDAKYLIIGNHVYTNETHAEIKYIEQVTTISYYDALFVDAFAWRIAMEVAVAVTGDLKKQVRAQQGYSASMLYAQSIDARESHEDVDTFNRYRNARG